MKGPENVSFATVEMTVGTLNSFAVLARIWTLLTVSRHPHISNTV